MNLGSIAQQVRARKTRAAVEGLENLSLDQQTDFWLGKLAGQVQTYEEVAQLLDELDRQDKYGDSLA